MFNNILMVCVGNICRSPMAEALLRNKLIQRKSLKIASAGVGALVGHSADTIAQALMLEKNIDISTHKARQLDGELLSEYDLVLVMEKGHIDAVHHIAPLSRGRVHLLGKWSDFEISDPYKQPRHEFEVALELIERGVDEWVNKI
ncbi:MAG: low molecular weight phosphotyrosine protein phosphatase [Gammaproteobacteria bacterium]|uniref:protein-tyrosine-phosphatase n=1 Tax=endosymbiont of Bathymodiolus septemdierum str. Myojin knoll TaxID=1303921 RepID=A0A0N7KBD4_9GAMM|nr:low molecular weight protein-tyrosine-phosphatase [Bathymodiolus septemdierum thioautotrophic gill symbiont]RUA05762.1 MAG: low molecular weight phosphotyrosine protein phosphatase [Gammaproteobacteria bacterium]BAS67703.1 protein-tyrosine phosphatase [endosymbiont of Bathymodiolus septemdierum str. Myojin knoll]